MESDAGEVDGVSVAVGVVMGEADAIRTYGNRVDLNRVCIYML